ncbi:hypothetical protein JCM33374_g1574 [Metschnikowia sp. JCM 33374]|nr:hypothetical protein JCM33374_g1574 [Metschnikowia sp. JCM 33374]
MKFVLVILTVLTIVCSVHVSEELGYPGGGVKRESTDVWAQDVTKREMPGKEMSNNRKCRKRPVAKGNYPFSLSRESTLQDYLANNKYYVDSIRDEYSNKVFEVNAKGQTPHTLWIGCSDSRAGDSSLGTLPGEILTYRNIANVVNPHDISSQSIIEFAVNVVKVRKIIVCGHTMCGGPIGALSDKSISDVIDLWINPIRQVRAANVKVLDALKNDPVARADKLSELNVIASARAVMRHPSALNALRRGEIEVWGMIHNVSTGYLHEVKIPKDEFEDVFYVSQDGGAK